MKAIKVNEYSKRNKNGQMQTNYVYKLIGTEQEIADFNGSKSAKTIAKEDDAETGVKAGDTLWVTSNYEGETVDRVVLTKLVRKWLRTTSTVSFVKLLRQL